MGSIQESPVLGQALEKAESVAKNEIIRTSDLDRKTRERLVAANYLVEVVRGWYILTTPGGAGTSTLWYSNYWSFLQEYLNERFGEDGYCLTPESSLDIYAGQNFISDQLTIMTKKPSNQPTKLLYGTSLLFYRDPKAFPKTIEKVDGLNLFSLEEGIASVASSYFTHKTLNMEIVLKNVKSVSNLSRALIEKGIISSANRVIGGLLELGDDKIAKQLLEDMSSAGYSVKPINPFEKQELFLKGSPRITSPHAARIEALWKKLRVEVINNFPPPRDKTNRDKTLKIIEKLYSEDAYHSLSIEGYKVTQELIEKVKNGTYDSQNNEKDKRERDALAAKGYAETFKKVTESVLKVFKGEGSAGDVFSDDLQDWYRQLFTPMVTAGLERAVYLSGYRNGPIYISQSKHVPVAASGVVDSMEILEKLLKEEEHPAVRAILGHWIFGYIHPYMDGNGRIARFLMNLMLVTGGYGWTVVRTEERDKYMGALEEASIRYNVVDFTKFIASEMSFWNEQIRSKKNV